MPDGVTFVRDAVLRPSIDPRRPMIALLWQESDLTIERSLNDLKNVVLHHSCLVAYRHNDIPLGKLRHT